MAYSQGTMSGAQGRYDEAMGRYEKMTQSRRAWGDRERARLDREHRKAERAEKRRREEQEEAAMWSTGLGTLGAIGGALLAIPTGGMSLAAAGTMLGAAGLGQAIGSGVGSMIGGQPDPRYLSSGLQQGAQMAAIQQRKPYSRDQGRQNLMSAVDAGQPSGGGFGPSGTGDIASSYLQGRKKARFAQQTEPTSWNL